MTALDEAIRIGEESLTKALVMVHRERRLKWKMYRLRAFVRRYEYTYALELIEEILSALNGVDGMPVGPLLAWVHALHQVTGLFALRGNKLTDEERERIRAILREVLREMDDDTNWLQLSSSSRSRPIGG
jgi:hypothetical protein